MRIELFLIRFLFFSIFSLTSFASSQEKTALIIHSYNQGLNWTNSLNNAIVEQLSEIPGIKCDIRIEYMDTKRFEDSIYLHTYHEFLINKYKHTTFDIIISTDNAAFIFLKQHKESFVKDVPVVFCGVNFKADTINGFTGIIEDVDIHSNIASILHIHSNYNKIYIAVDRSITGKVVYNQTTKVIAENYPDLKYEFIRDYSYSELKLKLKSLSQNDIFLLLIFNYDKNGLVIPYDDILRDIKPYCKVPIYGVWDFYLGHGIVGGKITSGYYHGVEAGKIASEILKGAKVTDYSVETGPTKFMFDYNYLRKFNINKKLLPEDKIIINTPSSLIKENLVLFLVITFAFGLLIIIIGLLLNNNNKKRRLIEIHKEYNWQIQNKQRELERALKESEKANALQKAFFSNVSHEIRTPLNGIIGFADLLDPGTLKDEEILSYADYIRDNGQRLVTVIDNIIEISRIESKLINVNNCDFNLNEMLDSLHSTYLLNVKDKSVLNITLVKELDDDKSFIHCDENKLKNVLRNLLDNAIKFTKEGEIEFGYEVIGGNIKFFVRDTGIGIPEKELSIIFDAFGQVEKGYKREYHGSGLGLPITKAYIEKLGGAITIKSELGKGTTVSFEVPGEFVKIEKAVKHGEIELDYSKYHILITEDDFVNYMYLSRVLKLTGAKISHAINGREAVDLCENIWFDLILMDIKMPEMNGIDASKEIFRLNDKIPIIIVTAYDKLFEDKTLYNDTNIVDYLFKPINKYNLLKIIGKHLI